MVRGVTEPLHFLQMLGPGRWTLVLRVLICPTAGLCVFVFVFAPIALKYVCVCVCVCVCNAPLGAGEAALNIVFKGSEMPRSNSSFGSPDTKLCSDWNRNGQ
jgi:hypothetical protein